MLPNVIVSMVSLKVIVLALGHIHPLRCGLLSSSKVMELIVRSVATYSSSLVLVLLLIWIITVSHHAARSTVQVELVSSCRWRNKPSIENITGVARSISNPETGLGSILPSVVIVVELIPVNSLRNVLVSHAPLAYIESRFFKGNVWNFFLFHNNFLWWV